MAEKEMRIHCPTYYLFCCIAAYRFYFVYKSRGKKEYERSVFMENLKLIEAMCDFFSGDAKCIQHFLKVYEFSRIIAEKENILAEVRGILECAAIVHDIGIKPAEEKYGRCDGKLQEQEGPAETEKMLANLGYDKNIIDRVSYLVGHHHTYDSIDGIDYQILVEADFLVNMYEDDFSEEAIENAYSKIFKTESGKQLCRTMF